MSVLLSDNRPIGSLSLSPLHCGLASLVSFQSGRIKGFLSDPQSSWPEFFTDDSLTVRGPGHCAPGATSLGSPSYLFSSFARLNCPAFAFLKPKSNKLAKRSVLFLLTSKFYWKISLDIYWRTALLVPWSMRINAWPPRR